MQVLQFIAPNAASALAKIHQQLGPEAVVLSVRPLPAQGVARFLPQNSRIEVLAGRPEKAPSTAPALPSGFDESGNIAGNHSARWHSVGWLEAMGLLPVNAERLQAHLSSLHGAFSAASLDAEWAVVSAALHDFWPAEPPLEEGVRSRPHVFIGPPGSGKTTALCKWLTLASLLEDRPARVFRLDGSSANTSDYLTIHCEMLGTPVERFWSPLVNRAEMIFIDLPGVETRDPQALSAVRDQLATLPNPHVHLVLNAAYETSTLLAQWRTFSVLNPHDLIFTHLDEEPRRIKLWNFVFGIPCPIRFLSGGQKIPGEFQKAVPELLLGNNGRVVDGR